MADTSVPPVSELLSLLKKRTLEELTRKGGSSALSPEDLQIVTEAAAVILRAEDEDDDTELLDALKREAKHTISLRTNSPQDLRIMAETMDLLVELDEGAEWV